MPGITTLSRVIYQRINNPNQNQQDTMNDLNFGDQSWSPEKVTQAFSALDVSWDGDGSGDYPDIPGFGRGQRVLIDFRNHKLGPEKGKRTRGIVLKAGVQHEDYPPTGQTRYWYVLVAEDQRPRVVKIKIKGPYHGTPGQLIKYGLQKI